MTSFKTSPTAKGLFVAASIALVGGGLTTVAKLDPNTSIPLVLSATGVTGFISLILGAHEHSAQIALCALLLPIAFWVLSFMLMLAAMMPLLGWAMLACGFVAVGCFVAVASMGRPTEAAAVAQREADHYAEAE